jgi:hypothetical protein
MWRSRKEGGERDSNRTQKDKIKEINKGERRIGDTHKYINRKGKENGKICFVFYFYLMKRHCTSERMATRNTLLKTLQWVCSVQCMQQSMRNLYTVFTRVYPRYMRHGTTWGVVVYSLFCLQDLTAIGEKPNTNTT